MKVKVDKAAGSKAEQLSEDAGEVTAAEAREHECLQAEIDALEEELAEPTARLDGFAFID